MITMHQTIAQTHRRNEEWDSWTQRKNVKKNSCVFLFLRIRVPWECIERRVRESVYISVKSNRISLTVIRCFVMLRGFAIQLKKNDTVSVFLFFESIQKRQKLPKRQLCKVNSKRAGRNTTTKHCIFSRSISYLFEFSPRIRSEEK